MPTKMGAINRKELRESALAALDRLGLAKLIDKKIEELSHKPQIHGGVCKRLLYRNQKYSFWTR